ncbi:thioredoxin domain-containing protein 9 [Halyomorpha halys]|uniref:thioredoxin domain-containing protein 9 n=1 Tax=Halyomorpha halys TaxID=286706 RepID=UPI0006D4DEE2|nr:thioredoxin domain-containing protein 9 [Halyomorpha halys]XP_024218677.1 thioredoxin domain-containing protein 9 [Halyomorpha halys]
MDNLVQEKIMHNIISTIEEKVDDELYKLDQLDGNSLEKLREKRLKEMKHEAQLRTDWLAKGHGEYTEIDEKDFFAACKKSTEIVIHFYKRDAPRCQIFDHHLKLIASKHLEARFLKINAENAPFLAGKLNIKVIPTLLIAVGGKTKDYIVGFSDLGNCDDFSTEVLEWRLGLSGVIKYEGDITQPVNKNDNKSKINRLTKKTIRENYSSDESD